GFSPRTWRAALCLLEQITYKYFASLGRPRLWDTRWRSGSCPSGITAHGPLPSSRPSMGSSTRYSLPARSDGCGRVRALDRIQEPSHPLSSRPTPRDPAERETEEEWRDPENASSATLIRGVLAKLQVLCPPRYVQEPCALVDGLPTSSGVYILS